MALARFVIDSIVQIERYNWNWSGNQGRCSTQIDLFRALTPGWPSQSDGGNESGSERVPVYKCEHGGKEETTTKNNNIGQVMTLASATSVSSGTSEPFDDL